MLHHGPVPEPVLVAQVCQVVPVAPDLISQLRPGHGWRRGVLVHSVAVLRQPVGEVAQVLWQEQGFGGRATVIEQQPQQRCVSRINVQVPLGGSFCLDTGVTCCKASSSAAAAQFTTHLQHGWDEPLLPHGCRPDDLWCVVIA